MKLMKNIIVYTVAFVGVTSAATLIFSTFMLAINGAPTA